MTKFLAATYYSSIHKHGVQMAVQYIGGEHKHLLTSMRWSNNIPVNKISS